MKSLTRRKEPQIKKGCMHIIVQDLPIHAYIEELYSIHDN